MATLREALRARLSADSILSQALTGGVFDASTLPADGNGAKWAPRAANGVSLLPFAIIRWRGEQPREIIKDSERRTVEIYFYENKGYAAIETAKRRAKELLHRQQLKADDADICMFHFVGGGAGEVPAPEFGYSASDMSRFYVDYLRK